jgi:hypothetical protein
VDRPEQAEGYRRRAVCCRVVRFSDFLRSAHIPSVGWPLRGWRRRAGLSADSCRARSRLLASAISRSEPTPRGWPADVFDQQADVAGHGVVAGASIMLEAALLPSREGAQLTVALRQRGPVRPWAAAMTTAPFPPPQPQDPLYPEFLIDPGHRQSADSVQTCRGIQGAAGDDVRKAAQVITTQRAL